MDYQVTLLPSARADLRDIIRPISFNAPDRALQFGPFLAPHVQKLRQFPELGRIERLKSEFNYALETQTRPSTAFPTYR
jgi:plasmid stabilization system protein ParE